MQLSCADNVQHTYELLNRFMSRSVPSDELFMVDLPKKCRSQLVYQRQVDSDSKAKSVGLDRTLQTLKDLG